MGSEMCIRDRLVAGLDPGEVSLLDESGAHLGTDQLGLEDVDGRDVDDYDGVDDGHGRDHAQHHGAEQGEAETLLTSLGRVLDLRHPSYLVVVF